MGEKTGIAWTDHTFNPWIGCTAVSPACAKCYAETMAKRYGWSFAERRRTTPANWRKPLLWNRQAEDADVRRKVFCPSLGDPFDNQVPEEWRSDLFDLIRVCTALDWQMLTKRPQNIAKMLPPDWATGWPHVWLGTTVESQVEADRRIPHLLAVPAAVRFLSCEPLLGPVDLTDVTDRTVCAPDIGEHHFSALPDKDDEPGENYVDWVIIGGESGPGARSMPRAWADDLVGQCRAAGVATFVKQVGSRPGPDWPAGIKGSGTDPAEWPAELRVQEFPHAA